VRETICVTGHVVLFAGPAGAGKSTLARAWCQTRELAAHVQLDDVRSLIVSGLVDPRAIETPGQSEQWRASVDAACALAISFAKRGINVAIDDLSYPGDAEQIWAPQLAGVPTRLVVVLPTLAAVLTRGRQRSKHVPEISWSSSTQHRRDGQRIGKSIRPTWTSPIAWCCWPTVSPDRIHFGPTPWPREPGRRQ
jgi:chloramphenicol 3-O-phosphotransferase